MSWKQQVRLTSVAMLTILTGSTLVAPILPLYIPELGGLDEREVAIWSGVVFFVQGASATVFCSIWGALSDRYGRKIMILRATFSGSVLLVLMALVQNVHQLTIVCILQGVLTNPISAVTPLIATIAPREKSGHAIGSLQTAILTGRCAGPILGGLLADSMGYRSAFWAGGSLLLLATMALLIFLREPPRASVRSEADRVSSRRTGRTWDWIRMHVVPLLRSPQVVDVLKMTLFVRLATLMLMPTLPLFIQMITPPRARVASLAGLVVGASALAGALGGPVVGRVGDRSGHRTMLRVCTVASAAMYAAHIFVHSPSLLVPLQIGIGFALGGIFASTRASIATSASYGREGLVYGVEGSITSFAFALGPVIGSVLAAWLGLRAPFAAAASLFAVASLVGLRKRGDLEGEEAEQRLIAPW
jgi:DHA1 family multidrug resistance protein-like MFS transporter